MAQKKAAFKVALWCGPLLFTGIQFAPAPHPTNPPVHQASTIEAHVAVPPSIARILNRACMDCHGNQTRWPWYSRFAPGSWIVASDVNRARAVLNFSEWDPDIGPGLLAAACADVQSGRMPKPDYVLLHPEARLSPAEQRQLCSWTHSEIQSLLRANRQAQPAATTE